MWHVNGLKNYYIIICDNILLYQLKFTIMTPGDQFSPFAYIYLHY